MAPGMVIFQGPWGVLPEEGRVGLDETADLTHGRADDQSGSRDDAGPRDLSVRPLPLPQDARDGLVRVGDQPLQRLAHGGAPGRAAVLAVGEDVDAGVALHVEGAKHGGILHLAQLLEGPVAVGVRGACLQQLRRAKQAANVVGPVRRRHGDLQLNLSRSIGRSGRR